jgi:hypothetical protein
MQPELMAHLKVGRLNDGREGLEELKWFLESRKKHAIQISIEKT